MDSKIKLRSYKKSDNADLIYLIEEMHKSMMHFDTLGEYGLKRGYGAVKLKEILKGVSKKSVLLYVAEVDRRVVGYVTGEISEKPSKEEQLGLKFPLVRFGTINELYVDPQYRELGVGIRLMDKIESSLRRKGCNCMSFGAYMQNKKAIEFYKGRGYTVASVSLFKKFK